MVESISEEYKLTWNQRKPTVVGITGCSRSGKGWVSSGLKEVLEAQGKNVVVVGQDRFWRGARPVKVRGEMRSSEEEPEWTDHESFANAIEAAMRIDKNNIVIAEGFQLLQSDRVKNIVNQVFFLQLDEEEARIRRTGPRGALNPNPLTKQKFDDLLWPAYQRYWSEKVEPGVLAGEIIQIEGPKSSSERDDVINQILEMTNLLQ